MIIPIVYLFSPHLLSDLMPLICGQTNPLLSETKVLGAWTLLAHKLLFASPEFLYITRHDIGVVSRNLIHYVGVHRHITAQILLPMNVLHLGTQTLYVDTLADTSLSETWPQNKD